tara:strand:- start:136770 stop:138407 length:1638 start_codon:yes stop_codon:yes gene_type:complete
MNGGESLVQTLLKHNIKHVFGVPGESYLSVLEAMRIYRNNITFINTRHESGASFAADCYGRLTSTPGVAFVTRGPGATNASIGIHTAKQDSNPLVMFVGQVPTNQLGRESFQEIDYRKMFDGVAKAVFEPLTADDVSKATAEGLHYALDGRPGPVIISLPEDVGFDQTQTSIQTPFGPRKVINPEQRDIESAANIIKNSKYPVIIAGEMVNFERCNELIERFANQIGAGVVSGFRRQGVINSENPCYFGHFGLTLMDYQKDFWNEVDVVIGLGTRMDGATSMDFELVTPNQSLIQVFPDSSSLVNNKPSIGISADTIPTLNMLMGILPESPPKNRLEWRSKVSKSYRNWTNSDINYSIGPVNLAKIAADLSDILPRDGIMTCDAGNFSTWFQRHGSFRHSRAQAGPAVGAMGYSVPAALGAKIAFPNRQVVAVAGDGGFMMTGQELISAVENQKAIVVIVCDNSAYGTIAMHQYVKYGPESNYGTLTKSPDFAATARAWGAQAWTVKETDEFQPALQEALQCGEPSLIHILTDLRDLSGTGLKME